MEKEHLTRAEILFRKSTFSDNMTKEYPDWDLVLLFGDVNRYYFTGSIQNGFVAITRSGDMIYFVRKSYERALAESPWQNIEEIRSYREAAEILGKRPGRAYVDASHVTHEIVLLLERYFSFDKLGSADQALLKTRSIKSDMELEIMREGGRIHQKVLCEIAPSFLYEGISETEFIASLYKEMVLAGYQGLSRFAMFQVNMVAGQIGFGTSPLLPTYFDGAAGNSFIHPAIPTLGSMKRKLKKGDLVFIDVAFGYKGYHTDKTLIYSFGQPPPAEVSKTHAICMEIEKKLAGLLHPGAIPSEIYREIMEGLDDDFAKGFMGYDKNTVKFLGHGVGLNVDEYPVIANRFDEPLRENMTIALEPKKGIKGLGMAGVEETYIVTAHGAECITGGPREILTLK